MPSELSAEQWEQVKHLFSAAMEHPREERSAFLTEACAADGAVRFEVERLLTEHEAAGTFLAKPVGLPPATGENWKFPLLTREESRSTRDSSASSLSEDGGRFAAGTVLGSRYRILGLLGRGGMGEV